jgi:type IV secretion system protein VirD4
VKLYIIVQDISQLNEKYGKDNVLMSNCHTRIAYAPNNIETARILSELVGKTTVVERKSSISGSGSKRNKSMSIQETARPLLTPDECMRLPGPKVNADKQIIEAGDMLILNAGRSPIYGRQILYFRDATFMARAKMPAPEKSDTLYPEETEKTKTVSASAPAAAVKRTFTDYLSGSKGESHV